MVVFITGVSKGLGSALAKEYLEQKHFVTGIGRSNSIDSDNYKFINCDLSNWEEVNALEIEIPKNENILLINNAGILGEIERVGTLEKDFSAEIFQINTIAPIQLCRKFIQLCDKKNANLTILNISSGAGRRAIPSWANYCASKAALDLFSETLQLEEIERGAKTKVFALAPGVIDTDMQSEIRNTKVTAFSSVSNFIALKKGNQLQNPKSVAKAIRNALEKNEFQEVICRL